MLKGPGTELSISGTSYGSTDDPLFSVADSPKGNGRNGGNGDPVGVGGKVGAVAAPTTSADWNKSGLVDVVAARNGGQGRGSDRVLGGDEELASLLQTKQPSGVAMTSAAASATMTTTTAAVVATGAGDSSVQGKRTQQQRQEKQGYKVVLTQENDDGGRGGGGGGDNSGNGAATISAGRRDSRRSSFFKWGAVGNQSSGDSDVEEIMRGDSRRKRAAGEKGSGNDGGGDGGGCGAFSAITPPLTFCLFGYFINKLVTEVSVPF